MKTGKLIDQLVMKVDRLRRDRLYGVYRGLTEIRMEILQRIDRLLFWGDIDLSPEQAAIVIAAWDYLEDPSSTTWRQLLDLYFIDQDLFYGE